MKKVLVLLISLFVLVSAEEINFSELVKLASEDLGKNIYLDKNLKDYRVEFNIVDHQKKGEIYKFLEIVLLENDMFMQWSNGGFYFIRQKDKVVEPITLPELPIIPDDQQTHYYSYKIKNITNEDVVKVMSIFTDEFKNPIRYTYLAQSDMIAYSSTKEMHIKIKRMLQKADNTVLQSRVKITLFTTSKNKFKEYGSRIRTLGYEFDGTLDGIFSAMRSGSQSQFNLKDSFTFNFSLFALKGYGLADIKQEPTLFLTNGTRTSVDYVKNVAYKESTTTYKDNVKTISDQIKYRDIGFKISVLPKIKDNWVYIDLSLISEELISLKDNIPLTQKISYKSKVKIYKGKPILLTGLKKTSERIERDGVPILSDLPWVGELFKKRKSHHDEQNINILIEVL